MSWRDGMRFLAWWEENKNKLMPYWQESEKELKDVMENCYEKAFIRGWECSSTFDPKWDSD